MLIYFDNNATTKIAPEVLGAMMPYLTDNFANASSTHAFGLGANDAVKKARQQVSDLIACETNEIIFTSGATEAINLGIKGVALTNLGFKNHIVTSQTEHKAVLDTCKYLESIGFEITYLPVSEDGLIDIINLENALRPQTLLVAIMWVNNETGVIQPIDEIAEITHNNGSLFFTDATQAVGKIPLNINNIDMLSFSAHKFHGPKGVGGLYVKKGIKFESQIHGGGHEFGLRSGTSNVPAIVGLGAACELSQNCIIENKEIVEPLRNYLESELLKISGTILNGNSKKRLYNVSNLSFPNIDANVLIGQLKNIAVSNGSACTASIVQPSHVLKAMGNTDEQAMAAIRFSLCKYNTKDEIDITINEIKRIMRIDVSL